MTEKPVFKSEAERKAYWEAEKKVWESIGMGGIQWTRDNDTEPLPLNSQLTESMIQEYIAKMKHKNSLK